MQHTDAVARTVGVEEEFLVVPGDGAVPHPVGEQVAQAAADGSSGQFEHELMQEQVELGTEPHESTAALREELVRRRAELARAARGHGARLAALATSPLPADPHLTPEARYERMAATFGRVAGAQLTCGMHVHVSVASRSEGITALRRMRPWLPVLLALTTNSPLWEGSDTGYAGYRSILWGQWPTAGVVPHVTAPEDYDRLVRDLVASGAAEDEGMVYFDARLSHRYPTVEVRVCDVTPYADDAVTVAALLRAVVTTVVDDPDPLCDNEIPSYLLHAASWRAARFGMTGELLDLRAGVRPTQAWEVVESLLAYLSPALSDTGDLAVVQAGLDRIQARGTGADLQRRTLEESGSLDAVVDAVCRETVAG